MPQLPVEFDQHPEVLIADITPSSAAETDCRGLPGADRKSVRPFDITLVAQLERRLGAALDISEDRHQRVTTADPGAQQQGLSQPRRRGQTSLNSRRQPVSRMPGVIGLDPTIAEVQYCVVDPGPRQAPDRLVSTGAGALGPKSPSTSTGGQHRPRNEHQDHLRRFVDQLVLVCGRQPTEARCITSPKDAGPRQRLPRRLVAPGEQHSPGQPLPLSLVDQSLLRVTTESVGLRLGARHHPCLRTGQLSQRCRWIHAAMHPSTLSIRAGPRSARGGLSTGQ